MKTPRTSCPWLRSSAEAKELSTQPDIASTTFLRGTAMGRKSVEGEFAICNLQFAIYLPRDQGCCCCRGESEAILFRPMWSAVISVAVRVRLFVGRVLSRLGFGGDGFLLVLAILIGVMAAFAAVGFHFLIGGIRDSLFLRLAGRILLYGKGLGLLILLPAIGGLLVGLITRYVFGVREGHGIVDVMESVIRSSGIVRPLSAVEKIITSAITIGTGGSAGAEGPIVQIGAGIASGVGQLFGVARAQMPLLIGCGSAAGISAIFNSPLGGVFFTLEVILLDFSSRTFAPQVLASVIANVATKEIFAWRGENYEAIFAMPPWEISNHADLAWTHLPNFILLGMVCVCAGVALRRMMNFT